jgi:hypothetical protein
VLSHHLAGRSIQEAIVAIATAPLTEAEIRAAIEASLNIGASDADVGELVYDFLRVIRYEAPKDRGPNYGGCLWDDLKPSQAAILEARLEQVYLDLDGPIERMIVDAVTAAALAFAAEYPEAPRATS